MQKPKHGGARKGAGRKPIGDKRLKKIFAYVDDAQMALILKLGDGNISAGIRLAINMAKIWHE